MMHAPVTEPPRRSRYRATRRGFLIGSAAAAGLVVGVALWPRDRPLNWVVADDESRLGAWLKIGSDGRVVVAVPQAEMGQGVLSAFAQIVGDELGADWATLSVEPAPLHAAYANRGMLLDATAGLPEAFRGMARWAGGEVLEHFALQLTGGSTSVRGFHDGLRLAAAGAREMLCRAAARDWGADWEECTTANGFVVHQANKARFAALAPRAALEAFPSSPTLRPGTLVGKPLLRVDIPAKTDGSARFGADVRLPGMVYAAVRSGPVGDPKLGSVDINPVLGQPGVVGVTKGPSWVAVAARTWWEADRALALLEPEFAATPKPAGPWIAAALNTALAAPGTTVEDAGDAAELLAGGKAITADYAVPFLAHACMETMTATARVTRGARGLTAEVWTPTQSLTLATWQVAQALGVEDAAVTVYPTLLGGGFGRKAEADAAVQAALIARDLKRPVQLIWSRAEDFAQDRFRPAAAARLRGVLGADRQIAAWGCRIAVPDASASFGARAMPAMGGEPKAGGGAIEGAHGLPYAFGAVLTEHALVRLPVPLGFWRSVGHSFTAFFVESFIDELAHAAQADPVAFRLAMLKGAPRHAAVLRAVAEAAGPVGRGGPGEGRGVALAESFGSIVAQIVEVDMSSGSPKVVKVTAAIDCGRVINPDTVRAQIEGGIVMGLGAALRDGITFTDGVADQQGFDSQPPPLLAETPEIEVIIVNSGGPLGGVGEPGVPPVAPALANAIFAATGERRRTLPLG